MRLIDAEALMDNLHDGIFGDAELKADYELLGIDDYIKNQPTAYDLDKVLIELEETAIRQSATTKDKIPILDSISYDSVEIIVERGGIDDRD